MEREVQNAISLGIALVMLAALLTIIMATVWSGNQLKNEAVSAAGDMTTQVQSARLSSITTTDRIMAPAAAVYTILSSEYSTVSEVELNGISYKANKEGHWTIDGIEDEQSEVIYNFSFDIIKGLEGKVNFGVVLLSSGTYKVVIDSIDLG